MALFDAEARCGSIFHLSSMDLAAIFQLHA